MPTSVNIVPQSAAPSIGSNPSDRTPIGAPQVRPIPPRTEFDPDTKMAEVVGEWGPKKELPKKTPTKKEETKNVPPEEDVSEKTSRHQAWKATQEAKKAQTEAAKVAKREKEQGLALEHMRAGNITKAAELLGTTVPELLALTQTAALGIPVETKKLTPAEQREKEIADYMKANDAKQEENQKFRYAVVAQNYIREHIVPLMSDVKKYPLLNQDKANVANIQSGIYEFLNKEYARTGKEVPIADILDTLEANTRSAAKATLEQLKGAGVFNEFFKQEEAAEEEEAVVPAKVTRLSPVDGAEEEIIEPAEEEEPEELANDAPVSDYNTVSRASSVATTNSGKRVKIPFALLSAQDKLKALEEARKNKVV